MFLMNKDILINAKQNDIYLNELIQSKEAIKFMKYVIKNYTKSPARFMAVNKVEWDDLLQSAYIGLFKAIKKIDLNLSPSEWVRYSYLTIQGELRSISRSNNSNMLTITQRIRELYPKYKKFYEGFWINNHTDPTVLETMKYFKISKDDAFDLVYGMQEIVYQDGVKKSSMNMDTNRKRHLRPRVQYVEDQVINKIITNMYMDKVTKKQKNVLYLHYIEGFSKKEVSEIIGCSYSMITKHLSQAITIIRKDEYIQ